MNTDATDLRAAISKQHLSDPGTPEFEAAFSEALRLTANVKRSQAAGRQVDPTTVAAADGYREFLDTVLGASAMDGGGMPQMPSSPREYYASLKRRLRGVYSGLNQADQAKVDHMREAEVCLLGKAQATSRKDLESKVLHDRSMQERDMRWRDDMKAGRSPEVVPAIGGGKKAAPRKPVKLAAKAAAPAAKKKAAPAAKKKAAPAKKTAVTKKPVKKAALTKTPAK
jgi:hypothetical protein